VVLPAIIGGLTQSDRNDAIQPSHVMGTNPPVASHFGLQILLCFDEVLACPRDTSIEVAQSRDVLAPRLGSLGAVGAPQLQDLLIRSPEPTRQLSLDSPELFKSGAGNLYTPLGKLVLLPG